MNNMGVLPPLREELSLHPGPASADGSPTWTIRDPVRNRFYRIGWTAFEILSRWHLGTAQAVVAAVAAETTLAAAAEDVAEVAGFVVGHQLTRPSGPADTARLADRAAAERQSWAQWLLHHYLFFRIPLVRPDRWLVASLPLVRWLGSDWFRALTLAALLLGLWLVQRRWEEFSATLVDTLTPAGLLSYGLALTAVKVAHELAHAWTARHFGCRVPTMGVAFLVMWPVLYTDVNEVWGLASRRQRLLVGSAGIQAELAVAAWATLAWAFLPDGGVRQAAFAVAALTWISSLVINLSPFMRFDGYFLLMDALDLPNLHPRAFALARWWLRERLFALGECAPEPLPAGRRAALVAFAVAVWVYRLVLFLGIAVLVYHFFIKVVGLLLFAVEIGWFVLKPLADEVRQWFKRRPAIRAGRRWRWSAGLGGLVLLAAVLPWPTRVEAPAVLRADPVGRLYLPAPARLVERLVEPGAAVKTGQALYRFDAPDIVHRLAMVEARRTARLSEQETARLDPGYRDRLGVLGEELARLAAEAEALDAERQRLIVTAPHDGIFRDPPPGLAPGDWVSPKLPLGLILGQRPGVAVAYVAEHDRARIHAGDAVLLVPTSPEQSRLSGRVTSIDPAPIRRLTDPAVAATNGGAIPVRADSQGLIPEGAWTRLSITLDEPSPATEQPAAALISGRAESPLARALRAALVVLVREWGT